MFAQEQEETTKCFGLEPLPSLMPPSPQGLLSPPLEKDEAREEILKVVQVHSQERCWRRGEVGGEKGVEVDEGSWLVRKQS